MPLQNESRSFKPPPTSTRGSRKAGKACWMFGSVFPRTSREARAVFRSDLSRSAGCTIDLTGSKTGIIRGELDIVERHGGKLTLQNRSPKGLRQEIIFPAYFAHEHRGDGASLRLIPTKDKAKLPTTS